MSNTNHPLDIALFASSRVLRINSLLSYYGANKKSFASDDDNKWRIWREVVEGKTTKTEYLDGGNFSQVWDDVETLFPTPTFSNLYSASLNGSTQDANGGDIHNFDIAQVFTVGMWVNPNSLSANRILFSKAGNAPNVKGYMVRHNATTGALFAQMRSSTNRNHTFDVSLTAGAYQFVCMTYAGGSNISGLNAYINAVKASTPPSGALSGTMLEGQDFILGSRNGNFYFSGLLDEITVWDKELTQAEVTELYNSGSPNDPNDHSASANLVSYYPVVDDGLGAPNMIDVVGGDNLTTNGTLSSSVP